MSSSTSAPPRDSDVAVAQQIQGPKVDLIFDTLYGGVLCASVIAVFFLMIDVLQGQPLHTPSLLGTLLFLPGSAPPVSVVRLDMVTYFSIVHFGVFAGLAAGISLLCSRSALVNSHPLMIAAVTFTILTAVFFAGDRLLMPGVVSALGWGWLLAANALTGLVMARFIRWSHARGDSVPTT